MRNQLFDKLAGLVVVTIYSGVFVVDGQMPVPNWGFDNNARFRLCSSEVCNETRNILMENISSSIGACDDFYMHVCGTIEKDPMEDESIKPQSVDLKIKIMRQLKELISTNKISDVKAVRKAKKLYDSCVNLDAIEDLGIGPIEDLVFANGGWPLAMRAEDWYPANVSFQKILQNYVKMGAECPFFSITVEPDCLNNECGIILLLNHKTNLRKPWLHSQYESVEQEVILEAYYNYTEFVATEMAKSRGIAASSQIQQDVSDMLNFKNALFQASHKQSSEITEKLTIGELQESWDKIFLLKPDYSINWLEMISSYFDGTNIVIDSYQKIIVPSHFLKLLAELLKKTPLRTAVNYIHWFEIVLLLPFANKNMRDVADKLIQKSESFDEIEDRFTFCINHIYQMDDALLYMYAEKYFSKEDQIIINDMISIIQDEIQRYFIESSWMDYKAKILAIQKVGSIKKMIGYPDWYNQEGKIDEYYDKLKIGPHFFENVLNVRKFKQVQEIKAFSKPRYQTKAFINPLPGYGEYDIEENFFGKIFGASRNTEILVNLNFWLGVYVPYILQFFSDIPATRFQLAFSHPELPVFMLYGGMGTAIAEEILRKINRKGRATKRSYPGHIIWQNSTISNYIQQYSCLAAQYTNNSRNALHDPFYRNLVSDLNGFTIGLRAYISYKNQNKPKDFNIPAVNDYTDKQLFFYGLTNMFCKPKGFYLGSALRNSVRIPGALSNMVEFSKAFNCPYGSRMNPIIKNTCTL